MLRCKSLSALGAPTSLVLMIATLAITGCHRSSGMPYTNLDRRIAQVAKSRRLERLTLPSATSDPASVGYNTVHHNKPPSEARLVSTKAASRVAESYPTDPGRADLRTVSWFDRSRPAAQGDRRARLARFQDPTLAPSRDPTQDLTREPLASFRATLKRDLKSFPSDLWRDTKAVYSSPTNLTILGLAYGASLGLQIGDVDKSLADSMEGDDIFKDDINEAFGAAGNPLTHLGIAGLWYLVGQRSQDAKTYQVGKTLLRALIINDLSVMGGKLATSRNSPNGESFTFPSGHTSSTFTFASVMHQAYGPWAGFPLYGLGVFVAVERLDDDEHYLSDVMMGSILGLVIGHTVAGETKLEIFGGEIMPYTDPAVGATGLVWHKRLKPF